MRYRLIDAFTDRPFAGNPAAVFLLDAQNWPDESWMQAVAHEMSLSETAFAHPLPPSADADWALRWFTPLVEDQLCGHATLATAHALHADRGHPGTVRFRTRSGVLVTRTDDQANVTLDFPRPVLTDIAPPQGLAKALGAHPAAVHGTGSLGDVLAVFDNENDVRGLEPDFRLLAALQARTSHPDRGVIATAQSSATGRGYDFVSRFFTPAAGIPEDPATGSAHTALGPYWSARLGRRDLTGLQISRRTGIIATRVMDDRVELTGRAVVVAEGNLLPQALEDHAAGPRAPCWSTRSDR